ncbi:MAG: hypothetical protein M1831_007082 [Alyxoria varia]|nr:MAG: hypothetical protein M1831_007082 [Alyxoria varia]
MRRCSPVKRWNNGHSRVLCPSVRSLHLAPPFLVDDYTPRYQLLPSVEAAKKRSEAYAHLQNCNLCPRECGVDRMSRAGACLIEGNTVKVGTLAPHFGEEPCIQGHHGSGSVFFSGCNMRCVFCQNHDIAHTRNGFDLDPEGLAEWMMKLQEMGGVHNINFVTPEHVVPQVLLAILHAKEMGLIIPIVYNTSSYDSITSIKLLDGLVDVYLPDFKVWETATAKRLLKVDDYATHAKQAIKAMHEQVGDLGFTPDGLAKRGVLVRHLVMPGLEEEGRKIVQWLANEVSSDLVVHIMEQYFPRAHVGKSRRGTSHTSQNENGARNVKRGNEDPAVHAGADVKEDASSGQGLRYADINRAVESKEVESVRKAAEEVGLHRFIDAAEHGGFNI